MLVEGGTWREINPRPAFIVIQKQATQVAWKIIHTVPVGQPGTSMPSTLEGGWMKQDVVDLLTHTRILAT